MNHVPITAKHSVWTHDQYGWRVRITTVTAQVVCFLWLNGPHRDVTSTYDHYAFTRGFSPTF